MIGGAGFCPSTVPPRCVHFVMHRAWLKIVRFLSRQRAASPLRDPAKNPLLGSLKTEMFFFNG